MPLLKLLNLGKFVLARRDILQKLSYTYLTHLDTLTLDHLCAPLALKKVELAVVRLLDGREVLNTVLMFRVRVSVLRLEYGAQISTSTVKNHSNVLL